MAYDIFISYKRKSLAMANNLYYRLTMRGYSTFFDLEELGRDNFNTQLLTYIEQAKDVFVILEEGSLDACKSADWQKDWFCREVAYALKTGKNIIPILLNGYKMPRPEKLPDEMKELSMKHSLAFDFSYFNEYIDKLVEKKFLTSQPQALQSTSTFKFYSNQDCEVYKDGKLVCSLEGESDNLFYLPIAKKGEYLFKCVNLVTEETKIIESKIGTEEEKIIRIEWSKSSNNNNKNKLLQILKTNIASIIAICFVVVSVVLLFTILFPNHSSDYGSKEYESVYSEDVTTKSPAEEIAVDYPTEEATTESPVVSNGNGELNGHEWVDLGLSVKWATCNVGASSPSDFGGYYAWGETTEKSSYTEENSRTYGDSSIGDIGDHPQYDVARAAWGSGWRLPTKQELEELKDKCTWDWTTQGGHNGYRVTGPNGNSIFLPAAGWRDGSEHSDVGDGGGFWSSTPGESYSDYAYYLYFSSDYRFVDWYYRRYGRSVRPVSE